MDMNEWTSLFRRTIIWSFIATEWWPESKLTDFTIPSGAIWHGTSFLNSFIPANFTSIPAFPWNYPIWLFLFRDNWEWQDGDISEGKGTCAVPRPCPHHGMWEWALHQLVVMEELKPLPPQWETWSCMPLSWCPKPGYMSQRCRKLYILCSVLHLSITRIANVLISLSAVTHTVPPGARCQYKHRERSWDVFSWVMCAQSWVSSLDAGAGSRWTLWARQSYWDQKA